MQLQVKQETLNLLIVFYDILHTFLELCGKCSIQTKRLITEAPMLNKHDLHDLCIHATVGQVVDLYPIYLLHFIRVQDFIFFSFVESTKQIIDIDSIDQISLTPLIMRSTFQTCHYKDFNCLHKPVSTSRCLVNKSRITSTAS